ncbi:hypothetical protein FPOAC2_00927 [Fusarium poae]
MATCDSVQSTCLIVFRLRWNEIKLFTSLHFCPRIYLHRLASPHYLDSSRHAPSAPEYEYQQLPKLLNARHHAHARRNQDSGINCITFVINHIIKPLQHDNHAFILSR